MIKAKNTGCAPSSGRAGKELIIKKKNHFAVLSLVTVVFLMWCLILPQTAQAATVDDLSYSISNGEVTITDCNSSASGALVIPDTIEGYPVTTIGDIAFYGCTRLTEVTIPNSVTSLSGFSGCIGLTEITIPNSVTTIGENAFAGCTGLTEITIPESVIAIEMFAFDECSNLETVYYTGTEKQWTAICIESYNDPLINASLFCAKQLLPGDINGDEKLDNDDVIYLLWCAMFPETHTTDAKADFNGNGQLEQEDVIYLLWHLLFGKERYPLP